MSEVAYSEVSAPSRLHLGLHDCGYATPRIFGGVGVVIDGFPTTVEAKVSEDPDLQFARNLDPSDRTAQEATQMLERLCAHVGNVAINITTLAPEHKGFGSKTSLLLAMAQASFIAYSNVFGERKEEIVKLTGRGGTSGIGVNSFWTGGLIADGGHRPEGAERIFLPSSRRKPSGIPPVVSRQDMPDDWRVQLFYDASAEPIEGEKEKNLFQELMPLPDSEIHKAMSATYHGLIPAVIDHDITALGSALRDINTSGMKKEEIACQSQKTRDFITDSWGYGLATGLTSFGPTVFTITDGSHELVDMAENLATAHQLTSLGVHTFNNRGAQQLC